MADITSYIRAAGVGVTTAQHTGNSSDAWPAGGYAAWIESVTGDSPTVQKLEGNRVRLILNTTQRDRLTRWLDSQVSNLAKGGQPSRIEYEIGPVMTPWAMKYAIPAAAIFFVLGWMGHYYLSRG